MKKNIVEIILIGILVGCLMGCGGTNWNEKIDSAYKEYWDYSLGKYHVTSEKMSDNGAGKGGLGWNDYIEYTFKFEDANGKTREIVIDNLYEYIDFNNKLKYIASIYLKEELVNEIKKHDFSRLNKILYNNVFYADLSSIDLKIIDESIKLYDVKRGIKFKDLSLKNMRKNNIDATYIIEIILADSIDNTPNLKNVLEDTWSFIFKEYGNSNSKIVFMVREPNVFGYTKYSLNYDGANYNWTEEYNSKK